MVVELCIAEFELTAHARHTVSAVAAGIVEYFPATHGVQAAEPVATLYVPAAHVEHMPSGPVYPALQADTMHAALDVLALGEMKPESHPRHDATAVAPTVAEYVPAGQLVHASLPVALL